LHLQGCTITIDNGANGKGILHDRVSFIEISRPPAPDPMELGPLSTDALPRLVRLSRCIARGQATLVRAEEMVPFRLDWEQGLLVTTQRLVEMDGAAREPRDWDERVDVVLRNVTAVARGGLFLVTLNPSAPHQLELSARSFDSIFLLGNNAPFTEQRGAPRQDNLRWRPNLGGADNFYQHSDLIFRIDLSRDGGESIEYRLDQREEALAEGWYEEKRPYSKVEWQSPPPADLPAHLHTKEHYLLDESLKNPAARSSQGGRPAGFDPAQLPLLPAAAGRRGVDPAALLRAADARFWPTS
jgi:hypothetical protein